MNAQISVLNVNPTYKCTSQCAHCRYFSSPTTPIDNYMTGSELRKIIRDLSGHPLKAICIGGGEPMVDSEALCSMISEVKKNTSLKVHLITNASWAINSSQVEQICRNLLKTGVDSIMISADGFHQEFIPLHNIVNACRAFLHAGFKNFSCGGPLIRYSEAGEYDKKTREITQFLSDQNIQCICDGSVSFVGRGATLARKIKTYIPVVMECQLKPWDGGDFRNLNAVMVDNYGFVSTCSGISIGNIKNRKISDILREYNPDTHKIISVIINKGPLGLLALAEKQGYKKSGRYLNGCHACFEARSFLRDSYQDLLAPEICYRKKVEE